MIICVTIALLMLPLYFIGRTDKMRAIVNLILGIIPFLMLASLIFSSFIPTRYVELPTHYEIEEIDSTRNIIIIDGEKYSYNLRYNKDADTPYAVIAKRESNLLKSLLAFPFMRAKNKVYIYTNNISLTD